MKWYKVTEKLDEYGKKVAEARLSKNLKQADVAEATETTQVVVSHLEQGMSQRSRCISENVAADINEIGKFLNLGPFDFGTPGTKQSFSPYGSGSPRYVKQPYKAKVVRVGDAKPSVRSFTVQGAKPTVDTVDAQVRDTVLLALLTAVAKGELQPANALRAIKAQF